MNTYTHEGSQTPTSYFYDGTCVAMVLHGTRREKGSYNQTTAHYFDPEAVSRCPDGNKTCCWYQSHRGSWADSNHRPGMYTTSSPLHFSTDCCNTPSPWTVSSSRHDSDRQSVFWIHPPQLLWISSYTLPSIAWQERFVSVLRLTQALHYHPPSESEYPTYQVAGGSSKS